MAQIQIKVSLDQGHILIEVGVNYVQILIKVAQHRHQVLTRVGLMDTMSLFEPPNVVVRPSDTIGLYRTAVFHLIYSVMILIKYLDLVLILVRL